MKTIVAGISLLVVGLIVAGGALHCEAANLVPNGGFEAQKSNSLPEGWVYKLQDRKSVAKFSFSTDEKHSGKASYMVKFNPPGGSILLYPETKMSGVTPGKTYQLSVWVKAKGLGYSPNFIAPAIRMNYKPKRLLPVPTIDLMLEMKNEAGWKQLKVSSTAPEGANEVTLDFLLTNGIIWIDDVEITQVD